MVVDFKGGRSCANSGWRMAASWSCLTPSALPGLLQTSSPVPRKSAHLSGSQRTGHRYSKLSSRLRLTFLKEYTASAHFSFDNTYKYCLFAQCSVSCGSGIQRLQAVCRKQGEDGTHWNVDPENCSLMERPTRIRPCSLRLCESKRSSVYLCSINL